MQRIGVVILLLGRDTSHRHMPHKTKHSILDNSLTKSTVAQAIWYCDMIVFYFNTADTIFVLKINDTHNAMYTFSG